MGRNRGSTWQEGLGVNHEEWLKQKAAKDAEKLEAMEEVLGSSTKILVDQKGGNNLIYLPLDKLMERSQKEDEAPDTVSDKTGLMEKASDAVRRLRDERPDLRSRRAQ